MFTHTVKLCLGPYMDTHTHTHTHTHIYIYIYTQICTHTYQYLWLTYNYTCIFTHIYTYIHLALCKNIFKVNSITFFTFFLSFFLSFFPSFFPICNWRIIVWGLYSFFNHPNSWYYRDNYELLIRIPHFFQNRSISIIIDNCCYNKNSTDSWSLPMQSSN